MTDKLGLTLDELIQKEKGDKKPFKKQGNKGGVRNKARQMRQKLGSRNVPSARAKARKLRNEKVRRYGDSENNWKRDAPRNTKKLVSRSKRLREEQESDSDDSESKLSTKLKVLNLNNSISNEDLNVLFSNIGTLTE